MPALLLVLVFIAVPLAELAVIIEVGQAIGVIPTIGILLADSILGGMLLRSQGRAAWRRLNDAMSGGRVPHREALDGVLVVFGGALLLTPGFITDVFGLLLLFPPTRAAGRRFVARLIARRTLVGVLGFGRLDARFDRGRPAAQGPWRGYDVEGTATDVTDPDAAGERGSRRLGR